MEIIIFLLLIAIAIYKLPFVVVRYDLIDKLVARHRELEDKSLSTITALRNAKTSLEESERVKREVKQIKKECGMDENWNDLTSLPKAGKLKYIDTTIGKVYEGDPLYETLLAEIEKDGDD